MSESTGSFRTKTVTGPAIEVDCSTWVDTSVGNWAVGQFISRTVTGPAIEVDCSHWGREPVGHLELVVAADPGVTDATIRHHTQRIIDEIVALDPALRLTDERNGLHRVNEEYRVVLTPQTRPADVDRRLAGVCETANRLLTGQIKDVPAFRLESCRKAG